MEYQKAVYHRNESIQTQSLSYVFLIASVAAIGGFLFGFDSGVINGTVIALQNNFSSNSVGTGFSVASMLLGCAVGALLAGRMADSYGRKLMMIIAAVLFVVSSLGSGWSGSVSEFVFYRLLGGLAVGAASVMAPAYISEIAPAQYRGRLASLQQLGIVLGIFTAFISNYFLANYSGGAEETLWLGFDAWRWMYWMEIIPSVVFFLGALIIPESPRYLVMKGRNKAAETIFSKIGSADPKTQTREVEKSLHSESKSHFKLLLSDSGRNLKTIVWVGIILSVFQQLVGINVIFYYGAVLWQAAGFSESSSLMINIISGTVNVLCTFVAIFFIDKIGRRPLLVIGSLGMILTLGVMTYIFAVNSWHNGGILELSAVEGRLALIAAHVYIFSFGVSWGPVVWVMLGEMFDNQYRATALAVGAGAQWLANFMVTMTFPVMLIYLGLGGAYGVYLLGAVLSLFFVIYFIHETKGKTLEEISNENTA